MINEESMTNLLDDINTFMYNQKNPLCDVIIAGDLNMTIQEL
jgi:hypothetical protein